MMDENNNIDELLYNFSKLNQAFRQLTSPISQRAGISPHQWHILSLLEQVPEGITTSELALRLQITPSAVSQTIEQLADKGFIIRRTDAKDRRIIRIYANRDKNGQLHRLLMSYQHLLKKVLDCISEDELYQLIRILAKLEYRMTQLKPEKGCRDE